MRRALLALLIALALLGRWAVLPHDSEQWIAATPLPIPSGEAARIGGADSPRVTGAWHLSSPNSLFGSYSALVIPREGELLAFGDQGGLLRMAIPPAAKSPATLRRVFPGDDFKPLNDIESATRDPQSGRIWLGLEGRNAILRLDPDLRVEGQARPAAMRHWPVNGGPEAMARLADGRFVVLAESAPSVRGEGYQGLLFPRDPVEGGRPLRFTFVPPEGTYPSEMTLLPDGRVLILIRGVDLLPWPRFDTALLLADPADIRSGAAWPWRMVGRLQGAVPRENYEGMAVTGGQDGAPLTIWIVSDENMAVLVQRSLLLRLEWRLPPRQSGHAASGHEKARGDSARLPVSGE